MVQVSTVLRSRFAKLTALVGEADDPTLLTSLSLADGSTLGVSQSHVPSTAGTHNSERRLSDDVLEEAELPGAPTSPTTEGEFTEALLICSFQSLT